MDILLKALKTSIEHLNVLDKVFASANYPEKEEYLKNRQRIKELNSAFSDKFTDQLYYGDDGRQMLLNDVLEYIFSARGYFYMWKPVDIEKKKVFVKIILYFINQLMVLESISVDHDLRNEVLDNLRTKIGDSDFFLDKNSKRTFEILKMFKGNVHFDTAETNTVPKSIIAQLGAQESKGALKRFDEYSDSLLPKLPHGLWRELIVYIQLLRIDAGYILPLLLNQRIIAKNDFLKPPDFLIIKEDGELIGVEVGAGKETQSSNFSTKIKCQMVTAVNTNIPPRCPICGKWVLFCEKVIEDFSNLENPLYNIYDDIRCAHDCNIYSYEQVLKGECPYVKYRGKIDKSTQPKQKIKFDSDYHYHYSCICRIKDPIATAEIEQQRQRWERHLSGRGSVENAARQMTINCLKTNYPYFDGLHGLESSSRKSLKCYSKYLRDKNCEACSFKIDCERLSKVIPLIDSLDLQDKKEELINELKRLLQDVQ